MLAFNDLDYVMQAGFLAADFLSVCVSLCSMPFAIRRKRLFDILITFACLLVSLVMLILYAAYAKSNHPSWNLTPLIEGAAALPLPIPVMLLLAVILILYYQAVIEKRYERNTITRSSVKESFDYLTTGLCFSYSNGMVILTNHSMNTLCHAVLGRDLQNAEVFWDCLCKGDVNDNVDVISSGDRPSFRLADRSVWTFSRESINGIIQITAADTTRQSRLSEELREKNKQLSIVNERLLEYVKHVDELTRERERLETKANIHREFGQALLVAKRYIQSNDDSSDEIVRMLRYNTLVLRPEYKVQGNSNPFDILMETAASVGIEVIITGRAPGNEYISKLFFEAAAEALTNAVRHADAKKLTVQLTENEKSYCIRFTNDGLKPEKEIIEGGGLGSIRRKCSDMGGIMTVKCIPEYELNICIPRRRGESL